MITEMKLVKNLKLIRRRGTLFTPIQPQTFLVAESDILPQPMCFQCSDPKVFNVVNPQLRMQIRGNNDDGPMARFPPIILKDVFQASEISIFPNLRLGAYGFIDFNSNTQYIHCKVYEVGPYWSSYAATTNRQPVETSEMFFSNSRNEAEDFLQNFQAEIESMLPLLISTDWFHFLNQSFREQELSLLQQQMGPVQASIAESEQALNGRKLMEIEG